jgi:hypothetical protein
MNHLCISPPAFSPVYNKHTDNVHQLFDAMRCFQIDQTLDPTRRIRIIILFQKCFVAAAAAVTPIWQKSSNEDRTSLERTFQ